MIRYLSSARGGGGGRKLLWTVNDQTVTESVQSIQFKNLTRTIWWCRRCCVVCWRRVRYNFEFFFKICQKGQNQVIASAFIERIRSPFYFASESRSEWRFRDFQRLVNLYRVNTQRFHTHSVLPSQLTHKRTHQQTGRRRAIFFATKRSLKRRSDYSQR